MKRFSISAKGKDGRIFTIPVIEAKSVRLAKYAFSDTWRKPLGFFSRWNVQLN